MSHREFRRLLADPRTGVRRKAMLHECAVQVSPELSAFSWADILASATHDQHRVKSSPLNDRNHEPRVHSMATDTPVTDTRANASKSSLHILRLPHVCEITGLGRSMIYQLEADGLFPQRVKLTRRTVGWLEGEVHDWVAQRVTSSRRTPLRGSIDFAAKTYSGGTDGL